MIPGEPTSKAPAVSGPQAHKPMDAAAKAKLQKTVKDFEALVVGYMLKSMRDTIPKDEGSGDNFGGDMLDTVFDMELAKHISQHSSFKIGEMLYKQATGEQLPAVKNITPLPGTSGLALPPATQSTGSRPAPARVLPKPAPQVKSSVSAKQAPPVESGAPAVSDSLSQRVNAYAPIIAEAADDHGVDANLLKAVIATESAGYSRARSSRDAKGLMQLIDSTASAMGVNNVWDPRQNIQGGAKYLKELLGRFDGDVVQAVASYNAGPGAVEKHGGVPPYKETKAYVSRVMDLLRYFQDQEVDHDDESR